MNRRFLIFTCAAVLVSTAYARQSSPAADAVRPRTAEVDAVLADAIKRGDVPGVVAIAVDRGGIIYRGAFGVADTTTGRPLTIDAIFRIASMTKPITSLAAMQLLEQGKFSLDDRADRYLPELANLSVFESFDAKTGEYALRPASRPITIRHLLTHTSGLGYNFTSPIVRDFKPRAGEQYAAGPLLFDPGEAWIYGTNTDWIGRLVESISKEPLESYFGQRIFAPLGMSDTFYNLPQNRRARVVPVHRRRTGGGFELDPAQPSLTIPRPIGGGGLSSTAADYSRFLRMFLNDGRLDNARIVSPASIKLMSANQIGSVGVGALQSAMPERSSDFTFVDDGRDKWGLGFLITANQRTGRRSAGSLSWGGIDNTYFWIDPARGVAGVILMQFLPFADSKALAVYDEFERAVYQLAPSRR
jgi:CubicO group peptidase (beta-lactamase class C family)